MEITFKNRKIQKTCSEEREATKTHGKKRAQKLMQRLMELRAFENLSQVPHQPPFRRHELSGKLRGTYAVDLDHPYRLLFVPCHDPVPKLKDGGVDLEKVTAIEIRSVEDYH